MSIDNNHVTKLGELKSLIDQLWAKIKITFSAIGHTHVKADITDFPSSMPASDVSDWAKASTKPTYTASEVGALPDTTVIPTVPTNVSAFNNDAGYLTESTVDKEIFWCTNSTTFSEITSAINDGKFVVVKYRYTPAEGTVLDYTIPIVDGDVKTNKYTFSRIIDSTGSKVNAEITSDDEWSFRYGGSWGINITGNAATADNASGRKFTVQSEGEEAFIKASNGTQSVVLDVLGDGSMRGVWCNASGTGSSVWALQINQNNVVTLNGTATYANTAKKLDVSAKIGSSSNPVFIGANGVPSECGFSIVIGSTGTDTSTLYFV